MSENNIESYTVGTGLKNAIFFCIGKGVENVPLKSYITDFCLCDVTKHESLDEYLLNIIPKKSTAPLTIMEKNSRNGLVIGALVGKLVDVLVFSISSFNMPNNIYKG